MLPLLEDFYSLSYVFFSSVRLLCFESGLPSCITLPPCLSVPSGLHAEMYLVQWQCWETGTLRDELLIVAVG